MQTVRKILLTTVLIVAALLVGSIWLAFFSARPPLSIDPATLAGDGSTLDYCELPKLDGSGKDAIDIAKGNTPGCGYSHFPLPVLRDCTEPLPPTAADLRGLWRGISGNVGHIERVEQCGTRVVVTSSGIIHEAPTVPAATTRMTPRVRWSLPLAIKPTVLVPRRACFGTMAF